MRKIIIIDFTTYENRDKILVEDIVISYTGMMTEKETLDFIKKYDSDELVYLDAHRMRNGEMTEEEFKEKHSDNPLIVGYALNPETFSGHVSEDYIAEGRHTLISKHPRYATLGLHTHSFFEMTYVLEGHCSQYFENSSFDLKDGDFCILSPETLHYIYDDSGASVINILIRQSSFMDIFSDLIRDNTKISRFFSDNLYAKKKLSFMLFHPGKDKEIRSSIIKMYTEELAADEYSDSIILSLIRITFARLLRSWSDTMETPRLQKKKDALSEDLISYIYNNYASVDLAKLAEHFHFSKQYCSKLIIELTGMPLSDLRTQLKIRRGAELLTNTSMSVEDISEKLGYENPETFIRAFKRERGITPGAFRKKIK